MIVLREDQEDVRTKLRVALRSHGSVLAYAPTGFGKTVLASALIRMIAGAGKRVIFCVHRIALLKQTAVTLDGFDIPYSYIADGYHHNIYRKVQIASIDTLKNRLGKYPADYVFIDEAHLSASAGWAKVVDYYKSIGAKIIGLSGSPIRLDGKPLGSVWDTMVMGPTPRWLIENGFLSKYRAFSPKGIDLSGLHTRNGDYIGSELDDLIAGKAVMSGAVRHWRKYAAGKRTIAFAPSVKRAEEMAAEFRASGETFVALDGNTPQTDRDKAFLALADRQISGIVNCNLFSEGFDMSAQVGRDVPIECVLDLYPTQSLARHLQKHGRGLRRKPEPAILLDLVGGFARNGLPDDDREWSLDGVLKGKKAAGEEAVRVCPSCFAAHGPAPRCPGCGHVYEVKARTVDEIDGELEEVDVEAVRRAKKIEHDKMARDLADKLIRGVDLKDPTLEKEVEYLLKTSTAKQSKSPEKWAAHVISARLQKRNERRAG
ncbi:DEAD/DEAH box helicase [Aminobacter ciceronei]|uniref:Superfamily II DNA or RNA helicase n=1 Tax=Aminobacter ciceronei TaxID=150723 RepID=A0ABR6C0U8_9HYPH|nr:DEAD/DEAH box helicase [Aminobacter ciceronei]MBA8904895.1 superfamily II DNA or RNA helicase [Aminobacter ciceronei]MBA9018551.1 superfamily II DNA or RNA helicase [Aminobacter ciceronei]